MGRMFGGSSKLFFVSEQELRQLAPRFDNYCQPVGGVVQRDGNAMSVWQMAVSRCLPIPAAPVRRKKA